MASLRSWLYTGLATAVASLGLSSLLTSRPKTHLVKDATMHRIPAAPVNQGHARMPSSIAWIVLHDTESRAKLSAQAIATHVADPSAENVGEYFRNPLAKVSSHIIVDEDSIVRSVADDFIAYTVGAANAWTLNIEICGFASWSEAEWEAHADTLGLAAQVVAAWCKRYAIPVHLLSLDELRQTAPRARGITTHNDVNLALGVKGGHTDPGKGFPLEAFLDMVRDALDAPPEYQVVLI